MELVLLKKEEPFTFGWWSGADEPYDCCYHYTIEHSPSNCPGGKIHIAVGHREAFGAKRRRILVYRTHQQILAEFVGSDEWLDTRCVVYPLKQPGNNQTIRDESMIPTEFMAFRPAPFNTWVTGPFSRRGYAVCVKEDDHHAIVRIALLREQSKMAGRSASKISSSSQTPSPNGAATTPPLGSLVELSSAKSTVLTADKLGVIQALASHAAEYNYLGQHLFAFIGRCTGQTVLNRESAFAALTTPVASLSLLLGYFAFARQAAERAGYNQVCLALLKSYSQHGAEAFWQDYATWEDFFEDFASSCADQGIGLNEKLNRGLLRDIYSIAEAHRSRGLYHVWADEIRRPGGLAQLFWQLHSCHGIGPKIAAFICRDVVSLAGLEDTLAVDDRKYIQPVDVWLGRVAEFLNPDLTFDKDDPLVIGAFLADACTQAGVSGVAFNQGAWCYGSQIARSAARLTELLAQMAGGGTAPRRAKRLILISCGSQKVWDADPNCGPTPARDAYTGPFFTANRRYAERFAPGDWMVLSSRYGPLKPDTPITNYNARFDVPSTLPIQTDQLRVLCIQGAVTSYEEVEVLAGRSYVNTLSEALRGLPVRLVTPYASCEGNGEMMGLAKRAVETGVPIGAAPVAP